MSAEAREVHEKLVGGFTARYIEEAHLGAVAYAVPYDAGNELCDYDKTFWSAQPSERGLQVANFIIRKNDKLSKEEADRVCVRPFVEKASIITEALQQYPLLLVNDHHPDLQGARSLTSAHMGLASEQTWGSEWDRLSAMINISLGVATRDILIIALNLSHTPFKKPFLSIQRSVGSPHYAFPINKPMLEAKMPLDFVREYNNRFKDNSKSAAQAPTNHPDGLKALITMSPGGEKNIWGKDEYEGKLITHKVIPATSRLIMNMECGLLPVNASFGKGKRETFFELGDIIPPGDVTKDTVPGIMADTADYRRRHGEPCVFYAEELV